VISVIAIVNSLNDCIKVALHDSAGTAVLSAGNTLYVNVRKLDVETISQLLGKQNIRTLLEHGTFKHYDGQITQTTTLYTVPSNKRVIIYSVTLMNYATETVWAFTKGTSLQDRLVYCDEHTIAINNKILYIFNEGELLKLELVSGAQNLLYNIDGVEVDIP